MTEDEERRLASGWGRRPTRRRADPTAIERDTERARRVDDWAGADAGAIGGRAGTRAPQGLASGDTMGGAEPAAPATPDAADASDGGDASGPTDPTAPADR